MKQMFEFLLTLKKIWNLLFSLSLQGTWLLETKSEIVKDLFYMWTRCQETTGNINIEANVMVFDI